jgi:hypothetical protein
MVDNMVVRYRAVVGFVCDSMLAPAFVLAMREDNIPVRINHKAAFPVSMGSTSSGLPEAIAAQACWAHFLSSSRGVSGRFRDFVAARANLVSSVPLTRVANSPFLRVAVIINRV